MSLQENVRKCRDVCGMLERIRCCGDDGLSVLAGLLREDVLDSLLNCAVSAMHRLADIIPSQVPRRSRIVESDDGTPASSRAHDVAASTQPSSPVFERSLPTTALEATAQTPTTALASSVRDGPVREPRQPAAETRIRDAAMNALPYMDSPLSLGLHIPAILDRAIPLTDLHQRDIDKIDDYLSCYRKNMFHSRNINRFLCGMYYDWFCRCYLISQNTGGESMKDYLLRVTSVPYSTSLRYIEYFNAVKSCPGVVMLKDIPFDYLSAANLPRVLGTLDQLELRDVFNAFEIQY